MPTYTYNLNMIKPEPTDPITPQDFNNNFDILDTQIADLNRYKGAIDDMNTTVDNLQTEVAQASEDATNALTNAKAYTDSCVGDISAILDAINGEEV